MMFASHKTNGSITKFNHMMGSFRSLNFFLQASSNAYSKHEQSPSFTPNDIWELDRTKLIINYEKKLGSGAFCNVFKGILLL